MKYECTIVLIICIVVGLIAWRMKKKKNDAVNNLTAFLNGNKKR